MCLYPKLMKNRKYVKNKKNNGIVPQPKDKRVLYVPVGCGKCMECRKQKARQWQVRLQEEIQNDKKGKFVTLTFNDEALAELSQGIELTGYELENELATKATRRFLERWRKKYGKSLKHWLVTELGQTATERIHLHGILFTEEIEEISKKWGYGIATIGKRNYNNGKPLNNYSTGYVNAKSVNYFIKYVSKQDEIHKEYKPKILTSPGIGRGYMNKMDVKNNKYSKEGTNETYRLNNGHKVNLPIYYRNKIYSEEEREKLWLEKLDKEERWVNGIRVDISKGQQNYYKVLKEQRKLNKQLGYGDNEINWERKKYENQRRNINKLKKIRDSDGYTYN